MANKVGVIAVETRLYPNGDKFYRVMVGSRCAGSFDRNYVPFNCKKPAKDFHSAVMLVLAKAEKAAVADANMWLTARQLPIVQQ